jgi:hypothetical protein
LPRSWQSYGVSEISNPLGRENYVRLVCEGYLALGKPIPEEFWDEYEAIYAKEREAKTPEDRLLEITPEPMEVWAVMRGGGTFRLAATKPAQNGILTLEAVSPMTGMVDYCRLQKPDGTELAHIIVNCNALVAGDSLHVTLDASTMLSYLGQ